MINSDLILNDGLFTIQEYWMEAQKLGWKLSSEIVKQGFLIKFGQRATNSSYDRRSAIGFHEYKLESGILVRSSRYAPAILNSVFESLIDEEIVERGEPNVI